MGRESELCPSFFKVLIGDFATKLVIPPAFVKKRKGKLPIASVLKTGCGRSWHVMIEHVDDHGYCFVNGWLEFVNYHNLQVGDFLAFQLIDESTFQVSMFDQSCCEKESHSPLYNNSTKIEDNSLKKSNPSADTSNVIKNPETEGDGDGDEPEAYGSPKTEDTYFVSVLKKSNRTNLYYYKQFLPVRFVRESGIARKRRLVLRDPNGRLWAADLTVWRKNRYYVSRGWDDCRRVNNIKEGDTCVFKFVRSNVIQVEVLKKPAAAAPPLKKRGRGRPPRSSYLLP